MTCGDQDVVDLLVLHPIELQSYLRFEGGTGVGARRVQVPSEEVRLEPYGQ